MTAIGITVDTRAFPNPDLTNGISQGSLQLVDSNLSFSFAQSNKIRTLSTTDSPAESDVNGLLYSPVPDASSGCNTSSLHVPSNATKVVLPHNGLCFVALAPWTTANCTLGYLKAVQLDPICAFIFYLLDNGTDTPPLANSPVWGLGDGGRWKSSNRFPVYSIPSVSGSEIMSQLALYSGNLTSVPNGHQLADQFPPSDYVRLVVDVELSDTDSLPSLWVFLLVVLAILIVIIGSTSFIMHWIQRKRRDRLRRRVASGEVDLEALGIKRLTVPQHILDKMPLYVYASGSAPPPAPTAGARSSPHSDDAPNTSAREVLNGASQPQIFSQPTCAICLEDFVDHESRVRELPCHHIFHPECIDSFLRENSSLCPMCKKTVLPRGYCPPIVTNAMVRRERMIRRIRERVPRDQESPAAAHTSGLRGLAPFTRIRGALSRGATASRRVFSAPRHPRTGVEMDSRAQLPAVSSTLQSATALGTPNSQTAGQSCTSTPEPPSPTTIASRRGAAPSRREWARERALAMVGNRRTAEEEAIEAEERRIPRWRKIVGRVWPGLV